MASAPALKKTTPDVPAVLTRAGGNARFAYDEFFRAAISNEHTRRAYRRTVHRFLAWCERNEHELQQITPGLAGDYMSELNGSAPTKNQALAALRHFFDALVQRHAVPLNSFASVRGIKHKVVDGRTPEISVKQARKLLASIDAGNIVGLRDRAVLGVLSYTGVRIGAVARLTLSSYRDLGEQRVLRFKEKGGRDKEIPVRHDLDKWLNEYIAKAKIGGQPGTAPLFRAAEGKRKLLTAAGFKAHSMRQMLKRRLIDAGLPELFSPHSFRVTVLTDLLEQGVEFSDVQNLAGHASPTTTALYDRRRRKVTRNIVERISI